jgi:RNA polymerase sigma-70 factor (ECF subfamily)
MISFESWKSVRKGLVKTAQILMMLEWLELKTDEICKELNISMSNAWIILYRPRIRLRERLDLNRFGNKRPAKA